MKRHRALGFALFAAVCGAASAASAQTACPADSIVIRGSSASEPIINRVAVLAKAQGINIVYNSSGGSCAGVNSLIPATGTGGTTVKTPSGRTKYDAANQTATCDLATPREADIGVSDVYSTSCSTLGGPATPDTVLDYLGPVQVFTLAVYNDPSFPVVISAEAGFNIFGVTARAGNASFNVDPWSVAADVLARNEGSGTQQIWARALGLPVNKFGGADQGGSGQLLAKINSSPRSSVIGIIALNDIVPTGTPPVQPNVRPLAFKAKGQDFGYYPSSTSTAVDLINVRDGHYAPWANLHFFTKKQDGKAADPNVRKILELLETKETVSTISKGRAVPACAMQVSRSTDMGDYAEYKPAKACGCFFEQEAGAPASASCKACSDDSGCSGSNQQCVFGYCEAK
ncbi:hypothetical protein [Pendulispora albinea]|uniref:PBP domain-containing protein n=1 Tax=Pendulispora albinea TaxID=2741071 RepID=A0ABZ2LL18_9BACT